ncbi:MAG: glycoside hydrolase domain-containing protein, partial [Prevotella fusca]|uniref:glycoside hydrolase domain-containing protein n=1 Tax=Prevotella fusca TaxID=589436 RepID=UPI003FA13CB6
NPMYDSRFKLFTPGDTYIVYPGNHSSRRFEHIIRGVQNVAKIETLRKEYKQKKDLKALQQLEEALSLFKNPTPNKAELKESIYKIESLLNK